MREDIYWFFYGKSGRLLCEMATDLRWVVCGNKRTRPRKALLLAKSDYNNFAFLNKNQREFFQPGNFVGAFAINKFEFDCD